MPREPGFWYRAPGWAARALAPAGALYGAVAARRIARAEPYASPLPVICAGNFTAGGSGKTPFAILLARTLIARGERPVVLSRGYGSSERGPRWVRPDDPFTLVGDEPLLLARVCRVMVARDRVAGARAIEASGTASVILMDDGLQNPSLAKTLSFAVADGARGLGNGGVIPAGPLRMPLAAQASLVQAVVFNGVPRPGLAAGLAQAVPVPQLAAALIPDWTAGAGRYLAYAGIGNPQRFFDTARAAGADLADTIVFPDHARFTDADAGRLLARAELLDAKLLTTAKDHVRLTGSAPLRALAAASDVLPVHMTLTPDAQAILARLLDRALARR